jgi:hypothetical protein
MGSTGGSQLIRGIRINPSVTSSHSATGLRLIDLNFSTTGSFDEITGIYLPTISGTATNKYGIYDAGNPIYFGGKVTTAGDVEIIDTTKGIILKSPDGSRFRVTVNDAGALVVTEI